MAEFEGHIDVTWSARHRVVVPDAAAPAAGFPVVLALHGFGDSGARLRARLPALDAAPFATIYADAPFPLEMRRGDDAPRIGYAWYQYTGDQDAFRAALAALVQHLQRVLEGAAARAPLDLARVAVLGYSQGGYVAGALALLEPARFRALVQIATRIKLEIVPDAAVLRGVPILVVHGQSDRATPLARQMEMVEHLRSRRVDVEVLLHAGGHGLRAELSPPIAAFLGAALCRADQPSR